MRRRSSLIILVVVLIWVGSLSAADKLRISYSGTTTSNALLWVTKEARLFDKNGIDPEVLYLAASLGQTALIAGQTQLAVHTGLLMTPTRPPGRGRDDDRWVSKLFSVPLGRAFGHQDHRCRCAR